MIYYFTGQPGAGKTKLGKKLSKFLDSSVIQIDGDDIRDIYQNKDYSEEGRRRNVQRAHDIARFLDYNGYDVIISLVSPYRELRDELKNKLNVIEIYVHTTETRGRENFHVPNYEPPIDRFIDLDTTNSDVKTTFNKLISNIYNKIELS